MFKFILILFAALNGFSLIAYSHAPEPVPTLGAGEDTAHTDALPTAAEPIPWHPYSVKVNRDTKVKACFPFILGFAHGPN